jgi:hypothetical protein
VFDYAGAYMRRMTRVAGRRFSIFVLGMLVLCTSVPSMEARQLADMRRAASLEGVPGLFKTWDAEPVRPGEVFFSTGAIATSRDPGEMSITTAPSALAIGVLERLEIFGMWELQKRIEAPGIEVYRIGPDEPSRPATIASGEQLFSNSAPFIDVPVATGRGELYGHAKVNILSERRGSPFALSVIGTGKIPGHKTVGGLNRGLSTGDTEVGVGALVSKRAGGVGIHFNTLVVIVAHPEIDGEGISDLQNRVVVRGGVSFPVARWLEGVAEVEKFQYFFHTTPIGLNPTKPMDALFGLRAYAGRIVSVSAGYVGLVNPIDEDPARGVRPTDRHGFVVQLGLAFSPN